MTAALRLLTRREYSRQELFQRLSQQYDANDVRVVVDECIRLNLLSEERFVESRVRHRIGQGYGPERIKYDLKQHGIEEDKLHAHLEADELFWIKQAEQLILKKYATQDIATQKQKIQRYLYQRGYSIRVIHHALKNIEY